MVDINDLDSERRFYEGLVEEVIGTPIPEGMRKHPDYDYQGLFVESEREFAIILRYIQEREGHSDDWFFEVYHYETAHLAAARREYRGCPVDHYLGVQYFIDRDGPRPLFFQTTLDPTGEYFDLEKAGRIALAPSNPSQDDYEIARRAGIIS